MLISLLATAVLSVTALTIGVLLGIRVLVFDGAFGIIGLATTWMSLAASRKAIQSPSRRHPFGWPALIPLVVAIQGVAALATLVIAAGDAIIVISRGGQDIQTDVVAIYGIAIAVSSALMAWWLSRTRTDLVRAEELQWRSGAIRAAVVASGAGVAIALSGTAFDSFLPHLDAVLVLISCVLVAPLPLSLVRSGVSELLEAAPSETVSVRLREAIKITTTTHGLTQPTVRASKLGHRLYVEVIYRVEPNMWSIDDQDRIRREIVRALEDVELEIWPSVELTADPGVS
ncbi:MAG: cation transporter [Propionicimonas sp.]